MSPMTPSITKKTLREKLGLKSDAELAAFFGISRAAVAQWEEDAPVPERRALQAYLKRPDAFDAANNADEAKAA